MGTLPTVPTPPRQSRSIESTRRMLDAAEDLFRSGGSDALTVDAVIERAGTSTGAFYARFGNRRGLFVAMHERFLEIFGRALDDAARAARQQTNLRDALLIFFEETLASTRRHRNTLHFHMIQNAHDADMRTQGNEFNRGAFELISDIVEWHSKSGATIDVDRLDLIARTFFGLILETILFAPEESNGRHVSDQDRAARFTDMVLSYL